MKFDNLLEIRIPKQDKMLIALKIIGFTYQDIGDYYRYSRQNAHIQHSQAVSNYLIKNYWKEYD